MQLSELSEASGVSAASIKYYRREGLLPAGERITTTRSGYGEHHLERLALIRALREEADASISDIAALTAVLDDPRRPLLEALEITQSIAAGIPLEENRTQRLENEDPRVAELIEAMGWPDHPTGPRRALALLMAQFDEADLGMPITELLRYARPLEQIALEDLQDMSSPAHQAMADARRTTADTETHGEDAPPSDDEIIRRALIGSLAYTRLTVVLRSLAHASHAISAARAAAEQRPPSA